MKKMLVWVIVLTLTASLFSACGTTSQESTVSSNSQAQSSASSETTGGGKLRYFIPNTLLPQVHVNFIEKLGMTDKVEFIEVPSSEYETSLRTMCSSNDAPDIFATDAPFIASYVEMGVLEPLDGYWDPADFADVFPAYQNAVTYQGKIYAAPLSDNTNVLFYNTEMFESAGITAPTTMEDAWTWNQLIENAQKLTQKDASGNITVYGIMPTMYPPTDTSSGMSFTILPWLWSGGGEILSPDVTTADGYIDSPETRAVLEFWNDLYNTYEVAPTINMSDPFISGQVAMWMTGVNNIATWKNNLPDFYKSGKWSAMPGPKGTAGIVTVNGSWNLSMSANCPDKQAAWNLINAVSGKDGMAELMKEWGRMPARQSTLDTLSDYYSGPGWDVMKMQTSTARARYLSPVYPQISDAVIEMFNAVAYGENIDKAIAAAKQTLNNAVG